GCFHLQPQMRALKRPHLHLNNPRRRTIMEQSVLLAHGGTRKLSREELTAIPAPEGSLTHRPIPHHEIVTALVETLGFRQIGIVRDEYAVSGDGMKMFGI